MPNYKKINEVNIGLLLLINVVTLVERLYLWKPQSILEQSQSSHCPLLLRNDYMGAKVESIKRFPSQFTFLPLILDNHLTDLTILQQDLFHLRKLSQTEGKHAKVHRGSLMVEGFWIVISSWYFTINSKFSIIDSTGVINIKRCWF